jgi:DNA-binding response OmpR family regulator
MTRIVASYLENAGFATSVAKDGTEALRLFQETRPDCVVLDISMPGMDGLEVARRIRQSSRVPIIFLSALAEESDRIVGLELGADDYVTKPFSPRELVSRVRAVLRRAPPATDPGGDAVDDFIQRGGLGLDFRRREVRVDGETKSLTAVQFDILALLAREPGRVFPRAAILEESSGSDFEGYERTIDAHIKNIRRALGDDPDAPRFIGTVRGVGYRFIEQKP